MGLEKSESFVGNAYDNVEFKDRLIRDSWAVGVKGRANCDAIADVIELVEKGVLIREDKLKIAEIKVRKDIEGLKEYRFLESQENGLRLLKDIELAAELFDENCYRYYAVELKNLEETDPMKYFELKRNILSKMNSNTLLKLIEKEYNEDIRSALVEVEMMVHGEM